MDAAFLGEPVKRVESHNAVAHADLHCLEERAGSHQDWSLWSETNILERFGEFALAGKAGQISHLHLRVDLR